MKLIIALFIFLVAAVPALAGSAGGPVPDTLFGAEEKRIMVDETVVLIEKATGRILDIILGGK